MPQFPGLMVMDRKLCLYNMQRLYDTRHNVWLDRNLPPEASFMIKCRAEHLTSDG
jgi:hypothetical protein